MLTRDQLIERLSAEDGSDLVDLGDAIVPTLIDILLDDALALEDAPGEGLVPIQAAEALAALRAEAAVEPMLRRLRETAWDEMLHDALIRALPRIGAPVVEPALRMHAECDDDVRGSLEDVLSSAGVRDERIFEILLAKLANDPFCAGLLGSYGDERALEPLSRAFDRCEIDASDELAAQTHIELRAAIEELGGELTLEQEMKFARSLESRRRRQQQRTNTQLPATRVERPGRNEPCWCGGGKKYKRCHLDSDAAESSTN